MQQMAENAEKTQYIRAVFSPISKRTHCTSDKYPDCLDCALGAALECVYYVQFKKPDNHV